MPSEQPPTTAHKGISTTDTLPTGRGPELQRLIDRLTGDPTKRLKAFNVWWGPEAHALTTEQRAAAINRVLDQIERGETEDVTNAIDA